MQNSDIQLGDKFGKLTVMEADWTERDCNNKRQRAYICECTCGSSTKIRAQNLKSGRSTQCQDCRVQKFSERNCRWGGLTNKAQRIKDSWMHIKKNGLCDPVWENDFHAFLAYYLEIANMELSDFDRPNAPWRYFKITRKDESKLYGPGNLLLVPFKTERSWHTATYQYWWRLRKENLLTDHMRESYISFINTFGIKEAYHLLRRKDITQPHSMENSTWIQKRSTTS